MDSIKTLTNKLIELCSREQYGVALSVLKEYVNENNAISQPSHDDEVLLLLKVKIYYFNQMYDLAWETIKFLEFHNPNISEKIEFVDYKFHLMLINGDIKSAIDIAAQGLDKSSEDRYHFLKYLVGKGYFRLGNYLESMKNLQICYSYYSSNNDYEMFAEVSYTLGYIAYQRRFHEVASAYFDKALKNFKKVGSNRKLAVVYLIIGINSYKSGKYQEAIENLKVAVRYYSKSEDRKGIINALIGLSRVAIYNDDYVSSKRKLKKAEELSEEIGFKRGVALSLEFLGEVACLTGEYDKALGYLHRAEALAEEMAPEGDVAVEVLRRLGETYLARSEYEKAEGYLSRAYRVAETLEDKSELGAVLRLYGVLGVRKGDLDLARAFFNESIVTLEVIKDRYELGRTYLEAAVAYREAASNIGDFACEESELWADAKGYSVEALHIFNGLGIEDKVKECEGLIEEFEAVKPEGVVVKKRVRVAFDDKWLHEGLIVAKSSEMLSVIERVRQIAPSNVSVLITGETGTGKELVARLIHKLSGRSNGPFVPVNCASIPETMFEGELFGHRRGAFTGADRDHAGLIERADGGTLFLDEISELTNRQQASLLRVLQEQRVKRVGEVKERPVDIRLVTASNESVESLFESKKLRPDFYYRISANRIELAPLRARREDIVLLFEYYMDELAEGVNVEEDVFGYLEKYHWPGNVRELVNLAEVLAILAAKSGVVRASDLPMNIRDFRLVYAKGRIKHEGNGNDEGMRDLILSYLAELDGNKAAVARRLGISRGTLYKRMARLGI